MSERRDRSAQDREAARLERERRRTGREGPTAPVAARQLAADGPRGEPEPEPEPDDHEHEHPGHDERHELPETGETGEPDIPSGTRRVSHLDKPAGARPAQRRRPGKAGRRRLPGQPRRRSSWIGRVASVVALAIGAGLIWFLIALFEPFHGSPHGRITVRIPSRSSSTQIGDLLARDGVISSGFFFKIRATLAGERGDLRPGTYHLQLGMTYGAVLTVLTRVPPAAKESELTITEGRTRQAISRLLHQQHIRGNYLAATRSSPLLDPLHYGLRHRPSSLEGFLFPDTFKLVDPIRVSALVADQLVDFKRRIATVNFAAARRRHLSVYDVLKIASLIEAEAASDRDRPLVASVIYNRLADGMMLQLDSTARYATGNFTRPLTVSQLASRSPYNTHTHFGLPPAPIDSPGLSAIQAAANPARSRYLFFFSKPCTSSTVFASSYSQFLNLLRVDRRNHC